MAGLQQMSKQLDEAFVKIIGSAEAYDRQKATTIEERGWAEPIY